MSPSSALALAGKLRVTLGANASVVCERPLASADLLRRLTKQRSAAETPALLGSLFALCGQQHKLTAQRALAAAQGLPATATGPEQRALRATALREHVVQLVLHLPACTGLSDHEQAFSLQCLSGLPRADALEALIGFVEREILGMAAHAWLNRYDSHGVAEWSAAHSGRLPVARWFERSHEPASALTLSLPTGSLLDEPHANLQLLAAELQRDPQFSVHPHHQGRPAVSGSFNRAARPIERRRARHVYDLLAARVVDMAQLCVDESWLRCGAIATGPGEAIAYTELARGLLLHWVKLSASQLRVGHARVEDYRVVSPTDFCLHPQSALSVALRQPKLTSAAAKLLVAAFDPCLEVAVITPAADSGARCQHA
ncbi:MAG: hypothetical protein RL701_3602 [Pseudomonadota bacterium]|jgi:hypothetical protein